MTQESLRELLARVHERLSASGSVDRELRPAARHGDARHRAGRSHLHGNGGGARRPRLRQRRSMPRDWNPWRCSSRPAPGLAELLGSFIDRPRQGRHLVNWLKPPAALSADTPQRNSSAAGEKGWLSPRGKSLGLPRVRLGEKPPRGASATHLSAPVRRRPKRRGFRPRGKSLEAAACSAG